MRTCEKQECRNKHYALGLCHRHWVQQRQATADLCSVEGCKRKSVANGMCLAHDAESKGNLCSEHGCKAPVKARGLCSKHYQQVLKYGSVQPIRELRYKAMHRRVWSRFGSASNYDCVDCGKQAYDWSYTHGCSDELVSIEHEYLGFTFCPHVDHYEPRCRPCHDRYDNRSEKKSKTPADRA